MILPAGGFEGGDESIRKEWAGEFFFSKGAGSDTHGTAASRISGEGLEGVGEGSGITRRDDKPTAIFRNEASEPAWVIIYHGDSGGDVIKELVGRSTAVESRDIAEDHQTAIERGGDGSELGLRDGRIKEAVRKAKLGRMSREAFLLLAVPDEDNFYAGIATTLEFMRDIKKRIETVGHAMGAGEAGDKVIRADAR